MAARGEACEGRCCVYGMRQYAAGAEGQLSAHRALCAQSAEVFAKTIAGR